MIMPVSPEIRPCKICGAPSPLFGVADFNRNCLEHDGVLLPVIGAPVYYRRCSKCAFIFTEAFDAWSRADFKARIYNDDYIKVDPGYVDKRPADNAAMIVRLFGAHRTQMSCLDYGGGSGVLAKALREAGFARAETYDEFSDDFATKPAGKFNFVSCFEVIEHVTDPRRIAADLARIVSEDGLIFFSTLVQPTDIDRLRMNWWYIGPRNGHISLHSRTSLNLLMRQAGLNMVSASEAIHVAFKRIPAYAAGVIGPKPPPQNHAPGHAQAGGPN